MKLKICTLLCIGAIASGVSVGLSDPQSGYFVKAEQTAPMQNVEEHSHCVCGNELNVGDHTEHSDVTYSPWNGGDFDYADGDTGAAYLYLIEDVVTGSRSCNRTDGDGILSIKSGQTLYLCLNGHSLKNGLTGNNTIDNCGKLVLCDCAGGGTVGGRRSGANSGAVWVSGGTFDMFGGSLTGSCGMKNGGGIYLTGNSSAKMYGGAITDNVATRRGGGVFLSAATTSFVMYGGTIANNSAPESGGGVIINGGTFTMEGGSIINNLSGGYGGGVYLAGGSFTLSGGEISGNEAANGGGVCVTTGGTRGTFTLSGGKISGNDAANGGGVYAWDGATFDLKGGSVTDNTANFGGGVCMFTANNTNNKYENYLRLYSGEIKNNSAEVYGGGVCAFEYSHLELYGDGAVVITENENSNWLSADKCALVIDKIAENTQIGVSALNDPEKGSAVTLFTSAIADEYSKFFFSDNPDYAIICDTAKTVLTADCYKATLKYVTGCDQTVPAQVKTDLSSESIEFAVTNVIPTATCRTFIGWAEEDGAETADFTAGDAISVTGEKTLYAVWRVSHDFGPWQEAVGATTEKEGTSAHKDCKTCGKHFDADGNEIENIAVPKLPKQNKSSGGCGGAIPTGGILTAFAAAFAAALAKKKK